MAGWGVTERDTATLFRPYQDAHLGGEGCHSSRDTATHLRLYQDTQKGEKNASSGKDERNV